MDSINELKAKIAELENELEFSKVFGRPSERDREMYDFPRPKMINLWNWLPTFANSPDVTILEIGSREVVNKNRIKEVVPHANYIGFDFHDGKNVDVVGDAHKLSEYIPVKSVDVIISFAVFEHLAMPWVVAEEFSKVLKPNGLVCTFTHFSYSEHEIPWHFFQFNKRGLEVLFNEELGFDLIESGMGMPMIGRFAYDNAPKDVGKPIKNLYCSSYAICRKAREPDISYSWRDALHKVYKNTEYPRYTGLSNFS